MCVLGVGVGGQRVKCWLAKENPPSCSLPFTFPPTTDVSHSKKRYIVDRYNVLVYGGTKNYHGYNKKYYGNLMLRPVTLLTHPFDFR